MNEENFDKMGKQYQEKVLQAVITDHMFADQMCDVLNPSYFTFVHLEAIANAFFQYKTRYKEFPTVDLIATLLRHDDRVKTDDLVRGMAVDYLKRVIEQPLAGDRAWIEETSLEFCKRQAIVAAMEDVLIDVEKKDYSSIAKRVRDALEKGSKKDHGHEYGADGNLELRAKKSVRESISTGWKPLDKVLNGGWKRKTLCTFIAATGSGKTMFLANAAAALVEQGYNVLYFSLEMVEVDIALRVDSWFAEIPIDSVADQVEVVQKALSDRAKGRLIIKEFAPRRATVDTLRGHVQRLRLTKDFVPDAIIVDYADLLKTSGAHGEKRYGLEENYVELRALMHELDCIGITADQTNRNGLETELVTIAEIGEAYAKATVCDLIMTITRNQEMKSQGMGKLYNAKSRLGKDGQVFEFLMDTDKTVKVQILDQGVDVISHKLENEASRKDIMRKQAERMWENKKKEKETAK